MMSGRRRGWFLVALLVAILVMAAATCVFAGHIGMIDAGATGHGNTHHAPPVDLCLAMLGVFFSMAPLAGLVAVGWAALYLPHVVPPAPRYVLVPPPKLFLAR